MRTENEVKKNNGNERWRKEVEEVIHTYGPSLETVELAGVLNKSIRLHDWNCQILISIVVWHLQMPCFFTEFKNSHHLNSFKWLGISKISTFLLFAEISGKYKGDPKVTKGFWNFQNSNPFSISKCWLGQEVFRILAGGQHLDPFGVRGYLVWSVWNLQMLSPSKLQNAQTQFSI